MPSSMNIIVFRRAKELPVRYIGDIADIIPSEQHAGTKVDTIGEDFCQVIVTDLDSVLEEEFRIKKKKLKSPDVNSEFYQELLSKGKIVVNQSQLLEYLVDI